VAELRPHLDELRRAGLNVAVIGSGGPSFARGFADRMSVPDLAIYSDEQRVAFKAAGMRRDFASTFDPRMLIKGISSMIKHPQTSTKGDPLQQGGVLLVRSDGTLAWSYLSRYAGDHPKMETLLAEATKAAT
jgi:hypothetical protein